MTQNPSLRKVYVVTHDIAYECSEIRGVYSTQEKAQAWIDTQPYAVSDYSVTEWTVDEDWE
jgi:hypothetical protein